ncbi:hypothetical protein [Urbifossiella limnaea]|nr:hypothetical protein [Urbifossiella limnaea]
MTRRVLMTAVVGVLAAGFGCKHVGGKCDCGAHPGDAVITGPTPPYPTAPAPGMPTTTPPSIPPANSPTKSAPGTLPMPMPKS